MDRSLHCPSPGSRAFEVTIYNRKVRALLKENDQHRTYSDRWANPTRQVVDAIDADEAKALARRRYPPEEGFVIASVTAIARPVTAV